MIKKPTEVEWRSSRLPTEVEWRSSRLPTLGSDVTGLIHENVGIVTTFAFSKHALQEFRSRHLGEWKYLDHAIFELPRRRATRACVELALMLRALDDTQNITRHAALSKGRFGTLYNTDGTSTPLPYREVFNKIIHAMTIDWDFNDPKEPLIVCYALPDQQARFKWTKATIHISMLATACGGLASKI
jgi:hypothetical protein